MHFPTWVTSVRSPKKQATARLRYIINLAALQATGSGSVATFARHCEMDRGLIYKYIKAGSFTESSARKIEGATNGTVKWEQLARPLEISNE